MLGISIYGKNGWMVKWLYHLMDVPDKLKMAWRYRFSKKHRRHILDLGLKPTWYDVDHLMLHANFTLLRKYVEGEWGGVDKLEEHVNYLNGEQAAADYQYTPTGDHISKWAEAPTEAIRLYKWWMNDYPELVKKQYTSRSFTTNDQLAKQLEQEEDDNLAALMKIRRTLWT